MTTLPGFSSRLARRKILPGLLLAFAICSFSLSTPSFVFAAFQASSEAQQEERFNAALKAYSENRFTDARTLFEGIRGSHSEEAKKYLANINAYKEAMNVADSGMQRSPDELDAANLDFIIDKYKEAIAIKSDGPWLPKEKLDKATAQKARLLQQGAPANEARKRSFCDKYQKASAAREFDQAMYTACALANDEPRYSCGGDEAFHLCQQMKELVQSGTRPSGTIARTPDGSAVPNPSQASQQSSFEKGKAAFDANDFDRARGAFHRVGDADKTSALEYLGKIDQYQAAMKGAAKLAQSADYEKAHAAYQEAAKIKPDGPGKPQEEAGLMALLEGVSEFYAGNYTQAGQYLSTYAQDNTQKTDVAYFYMGASAMARFFLAGGQDGSLREEALTDFRKAKEAGFIPKNLEVSPKILKAYEDLAP